MTLICVTLSVMCLECSANLFFNDGIIYDKNFLHITEDEEYSLVEEKVKSIINLINEQPNLVHKDLEDELWDMV